MAHEPTHDEAVAKLRALIKDIKVAMLTTVDSDGRLHARPMMTQQVEFDGELWFFTGASTEKAVEINQERHVNVSYADSEGHRYISAVGMARLVRDRAKIDQFWNPVYKAWFPKGKDDPDLALINVRVEEAEYWDSPSSPIAQALGFVKAVATGHRYDGGENKTLHLSGAETGDD